MSYVNKPYLAVQGTKSSKEKFAGAQFTTTVEAFVPTSGRGIQVSGKLTKSPPQKLGKGGAGGGAGRKGQNTTWLIDFC